MVAKGTSFRILSVGFFKIIKGDTTGVCQLNHYCCKDQFLAPFARGSQYISFLREREISSENHHLWEVAVIPSVPASSTYTPIKAAVGEQIPHLFCKAFSAESVQVVFLTG